MIAASGWAAALFDLDGTLADTVELILMSYRHTMRTHLGEAPPDERWLSTMGTPLSAQLRDFARDDEEAELMRRTYVSYQREIHDRMVSPYPGASSLLSTLRGVGVATAVVTSKHAHMARRTLERCGLWELVDVVVCADQVGRPKPEPDSVLQALEQLRVADRPEEVIFVGDSPFDLAAGRRARTRTGAALWGPFDREALERERPDFFLEELDELLDIGPGGRRGG